MGFLASLLPAGISAVGSLLGGDRKKTQVQTKPAEGQIPGFVLNAGGQLADFVSKFLPNYNPGEAYAGQLNAPITQAEQQGQGFLDQFLQSGLGDVFQNAKQNLIDTFKGGYDPTTSDFFKGLRANAITERNDAIDALNREAASRGTFYTDSSIREAGNIAGRTSNFLTQTLGDLFNKERDRQTEALRIAPTYTKLESELPLRKAAAASEIGSIPRLIQQSALERNYQEFTRQQNEKAGVVDTAKSLVGSGSGLRSGSTGMVDRYAPSTFERVTGSVNQILGQNPTFFDELLSNIGGLFR